MQRPSVFNFLALKRSGHFALRASLGLVTAKASAGQSLTLTPKSITPVQSWRLLGSQEFKVKVIGLNKDKAPIIEEIVSSDDIGNIDFRHDGKSDWDKVEALELYEVRYVQGIEFYLGSFIPTSIPTPTKIIICDFDKTLVETRYSTTSEVYKSLTSPVASFPVLQESLDLFRQHIDKGHLPFILSASPHFYESTIRDWLYRHQIYTAGLFLKDYRQIFSFSKGALSPKDIKTQGLYKLDQLLTMLIMTGIPHHLVLMGDNFESDPVIYFTLKTIIAEDIDPWALWKKVRKLESFSLSTRQNSYLLNKMYLLQTHARKFRLENQGKPPLIDTYIRRKGEEQEIVIPEELTALGKSKIELYSAGARS